MKRVCYVIPTLSVGGTETQLVHLMRGLVCDHDLTVICTRTDGALGGDVRRLGADLHVLDTWGGWDFRIKARLRAQFRHHRPDIVHTFLFGFDYAAARAARDAGVPVVISSRRELATWMKPRHVRLQKKGNALVDCIVANSRAVVQFASELEGADPALFRVIPNAIAADDFVSKIDPSHVRRRYRIPFHTHVVGIVANFSPVKDHALFVEVARELGRRRADLHFLMVGRGPERDDVFRRIHTSKLDEEFTCLSAFQEVADIYRLMSVSVLCSKVEGFPNAVIESMASGTPVVAPAVGGIPELVEDGVTGRLVHSRAPSDFADAIEWVLDHPEESRAMTERAATYVRTELTVDKMVNAYRGLYAELLEKRVGRNH